MTNNLQSVLQAMRMQNVSLAESLVDADKNLAAADERGNTALHYAASYGHRDLVMKLVEAGAPLDRRNCDLLTPLIYAVEYDYREIASFLWQHQRQELVHSRLAQAPYVLELCDIGLDWTLPVGMASSGFFQKGSPLQFGHHPRAREIGNELHVAGGIVNMRSVHSMVRNVIGTRATVGLSACWHGVGAWLH